MYLLCCSGLRLHAGDSSRSSSFFTCCFVSVHCISNTCAHHSSGPMSKRLSDSLLDDDAVEPSAVVVKRFRKYHAPPSTRPSESAASSSTWQLVPRNVLQATPKQAGLAPPVGFDPSVSVRRTAPPVAHALETSNGVGKYSPRVPALSFACAKPRAAWHPRVSHNRTHPQSIFFNFSHVLALPRLKGICNAWRHFWKCGARSHSLIVGPSKRLPLQTICWQHKDRQLRTEQRIALPRSRPLKSLRWFSKITEWADLELCLAAPLIASYASGAACRDRREAFPIPMAVVAGFEKAVCDSSAPDSIELFVGSVLLCMRSSLRFGDAQRVAWDSLQLSPSALRGACYRTKTSKHGQPFACKWHDVTGRSFSSSWVLHPGRLARQFTASRSDSVANAKARLPIHKLQFA